MDMGRGWDQSDSREEVEVRLMWAEPAEEVLVSPLAALKKERPCMLERLLVLELECVLRILGSTLCDMA